MPRVIDVIHRLFPNGTLPQQGQQWDRAPIWPPDVFAIAATLVSTSGCYSRRRYTAQWSPSCLFDSRYLKEIQKAGESWGEGKLPNKVGRLWQSLIKAGSEDILDPKASWCDSAMKLMCIADEASAGIGFVSSNENSYFADYLFDQHLRHVLKRGRKPVNLRPYHDLPKLPATLCWMVPPSEVCVQPKARTPQVGCTLRSLSHHLALLPPTGEITTSWMFGTAASRSTDQALNLLLVPFPFRIDGGCFSAEHTAFGEGNGKFTTKSAILSPPEVLIFVVLRLPVRILLFEFAISFQQSLITTIRRINRLMGIFKQVLLHLPHVPARKSPVILSQPV